MKIEACSVMEYKGGGCMTAEKDSAVYQSLKKRYIDLKVILTSSGINLTEIDRIKE